MSIYLRKVSVLLPGETKKIRDEKYYLEGKDFSGQLRLIQSHIEDLIKVNQLVKSSQLARFYADVNYTKCDAEGK